MTSFRYRALTPNGEVVSGSIAASTAAEVAERVEYLGLIPIETVRDDGARPGPRFDFNILSRPRPEDVTIFTGDLALLLQTGARINDALELLSDDADIGRLRPTVAKITAAILAGESFADALAHHPALFSPMYVVLARVGEASGTLVNILEVLGAERVRAEALRRRFADALRYPAFVLVAASAVLLFFLTFVLPQFGAVLRDFNAKLDPIVLGFLALSDFLRAHTAALAATIVAAHRRRLVFPAPSQGARHDHGSARAFAFHQPGFGFSSNLHLLPQPRCPPRERGPADGDAANTRRFDGNDGTLRRLEQDRRSRPPRRQAFRRARQDRGDSGDGHSDLAARRRVGSTARCSRNASRSFTKPSFNAASIGWSVSPAPWRSSASASLSAV